MSYIKKKFFNSITYKFEPTKNIHILRINKQKLSLLGGVSNHQANFIILLANKM